LDIVGILESSISQLPNGEYTLGLHAILRHIRAAIRHLERDSGTDPDCYTDAIYRTNQAFEGSLKEAYRVLADKDPADRRIFDIESYIIDNKIVRKRVSEQIKRYRQDYRNPSTHDYKLDFDYDEALLAIFSVCGFAKLLVNQISERLAFNLAASQTTVKISEKLNSQQITKFIGEILVDFCNTNAQNYSLATSEFDGALAGLFSAAGFEVFLDDETERSWDVVLRYEEHTAVIETRHGSLSSEVTTILPIHFVAAGMNEQGLNIGFVVLLSDDTAGPYRSHHLKDFEQDEVHVVSKFTEEQIRNLIPGFWSFV
jgi:hypothetical protein